MEEGPATNFGNGSEPYPKQVIIPSWNSQNPHQPTAKSVLSAMDASQLSATLVDAVQRGQLDTIREIVETYQYDVNTPDREDCSLLQWGALNNHVPCMKYLIDHGADVNFVGGELRATPLHWASFMGNLNAVVCLIESGADPTIVNRDGCTTLHFAAQRGYSHIVAYLLGKGMDVNLRDQFGMTPLMWSTKVSAMDPARLLINMGADVTLKDRMHGNTALHFAVLNTNIGVCQLLLNNGADIDALNGSGQTPLALSLTEKRNRYVEDVLRTYRQEKGLEGSWLTRNILRNDRLVRGIFNAVPMLTFIFIGSVFAMTANYFLKLFLIAFYATVIYYGGKKLHFFRFSDQFALALYIGCKACIIATIFFLWLPKIASLGNVIIWLTLFVALMYNFCRTWLGDPGFVSPPMEDKLKAVVDLAEKNEFSVSKLCTTCLVVRPLRSKHCSVCGKCVEVMDHHCPFTGNCIGKKNHRFFIGYLFFLTLAGIWAAYAGFVYAGLVCGLSSENFLLTIGPTLQCAPWTIFVLCFSIGATMWVGFMCIMQIYQVSIMAMTTNERINQHRYGHFQTDEGLHTNPFNKGFVHNCAEFFDCDLSILRRNNVKKSTSYEPLLTETL